MRFFFYIRVSAIPFKSIVFRKDRKSDFFLLYSPKFYIKILFFCNYKILFSNYIFPTSYNILILLNLIACIFYSVNANSKWTFTDFLDKTTVIMT